MGDIGSNPIRSTNKHIGGRMNLTLDSILLIVAGVLLIAGAFPILNANVAIAIAFILVAITLIT